MAHLLQHCLKAAFLIAISAVLVSCALLGGNKELAQGGSAARSAVFIVDYVSNSAPVAVAARPSAQLGIYISEFLSRGTYPLVSTALKGIEAQEAFAAAPDNTDADYALLQTFGDALQVDIMELLNKSPDRQATLDAYMGALTNVMERVKTRDTELESILKDIRNTQSEQQKEANTLKRDISALVKESNFSEAGEKQRQLAEKSKQVNETKVKYDEVKSIQSTMQTLVKIAEKRSLAIHTNREALIAGVKVIDVPGARDMKLIEKPARNLSLPSLSRGSSSAATGTRSVQRSSAAPAPEGQAHIAPEESHSGLSEIMGIESLRPE